MHHAKDSAHQHHMSGIHQEINSRQGLVLLGSVLSSASEISVTNEIAVMVASVIAHSWVIAVPITEYTHGLLRGDTPYSIFQSSHVLRTRIKSVPPPNWTCTHRIRSSVLTPCGLAWCRVEASISVVVHSMTLIWPHRIE